MIGEKIKVEMIKHNMKNVDLARLIGVKASTITHYINGDVNPKPENLCKIACVLGVSTDYLYGIDKPFTLSISGFNDQQKLILECLSDQFRRKNQKNKKMSEEQYKLVAKIIEELIK